MKYCYRTDWPQYVLTLMLEKMSCESSEEERVAAMQLVYQYGKNAKVNSTVELNYPYLIRIEE